MFVLIILRMPVTRWVLHEISKTVRSIIGQEEEERTVFILPDKLNPFPGPKVGCIPGLFAYFAILYNILSLISNANMFALLMLISSHLYCDHDSVYLLQNSRQTCSMAFFFSILKDPFPSFSQEPRI